MSKIKFHPWCEIFPVMSDEDLDALAADITEHGLKQPILRFEGAILDGRNRFLACERAGIQPSFEDLPRGTSPKALVRSLNLLRRHLDTAQRAMIAARFANAKVGKPSELIGGIPPITNSEAAKLMNVSTDSVKQAKEIVNNAVEPVQSAVLAGNVSLNTAATIAKLPKSRQRKAAAKGPEGIKAAAKRVTAPKSKKAKGKKAEPTDRIFPRSIEPVHAEPCPGVTQERVNETISNAYCANGNGSVEVAERPVIVAAKTVLKSTVLAAFDAEVALHMDDWLDDPDGIKAGVECLRAVLEKL